MTAAALVRAYFSRRAATTATSACSSAATADNRPVAAPGGISVLKSAEPQLAAIFRTVAPQLNMVGFNMVGRAGLEPATGRL